MKLIKLAKKSSFFCPNDQAFVMGCDYLQKGLSKDPLDPFAPQAPKVERLITMRGDEIEVMYDDEWRIANINYHTIRDRKIPLRKRLKDFIFGKKIRMAS